MQYTHAMENQPAGRVLILATTWIKLENIRLNERKSDRKRYISYDTIFMKYLT